MLRQLHSLPGLIAGLLVAFMAVTGAVLSVQPALDHASAGSAGTTTVAELAQAVAATHPGIDRIVRSANGAVTAYSSGVGGAVADRIDPATGATLGPYQASDFFVFITELHRSLFLGFGGQIIAAVAALALVVLSVSGVLMLVKRLGGWRRLFAQARGHVWSRLHVEMSRIAVVALLLTALTGLYMALVSFGFVTDGAAGFGSFPPAGSGGTASVLSELSALQAIPVSELRELIFPAAGDPTDVFSVTTASGVGYVDASTGEMISFAANNLAQTLYEAVYMLHTGNGLWSLGLLVGIAALLVPVLAVTGTLTWWKRWRSRPRLAANAAVHQADAIILVGSETNATWGFAAELHRALTAAGRRVHTAPMNALATAYPAARQMFLLTSTHGDGKAPASASRFMARLAKWRKAPRFEFAVLGFGDHSFQHFSVFGALVDETLAGLGWHRLLPATHIDRQSAQSFALWGHDLADVLDLPLTLNHVPERPQTTALEIIGRVDYGADIQAPTSILRLRASEGARLPRYAAGDLLGIVPPGSVIPRYYSLASDSRDGFLEICVRKLSGGVCSEFLHAAQPGDTIDGFVRSNPDFRPIRGRKPVVMIGNGTGIAPFAGFIRSNRKRQPMHLYWGGRNRNSDFLYGDALAACLTDHRLETRSIAFSRSGGGEYVQDRVREDGDRLRALAQSGAQFLICGSREMADGVRDALNAVLGPIGGGVDGLKAKGRYLEDVY